MHTSCRVGEVAMEALGLAATNYNYMHRYLDDPAYSKPSDSPSESLIDILERVRTDKRLDNLFGDGNDDHIGALFEKAESIVMEYWNSWTVSDPKEAICRQPNPGNLDIVCL